MKNITLEKKKVFVSYCHKDVLEDWLVKFVTALANWGVDCIVDIFDLNLGQDLNYFMEKIRASDIDNVLMLLGKEYKEKANDHKGGVGTETQIISAEVYKDVEQQKCIPVIISRDENGFEYLPIYLESRAYIDFSNDDNFAENVERLARYIHKKPNRIKPVVSMPSENLFDSAVELGDVFKYTYTEPVSFQTFLNEFTGHLEDYKVSHEQYDLEKDESIWVAINKSKDARDIYIKTLDNFLKKGKHIEVTDLIEFFERLHSSSEIYRSNTYYQTQNDAYKFVVMEVLLYTVLLLNRYKKYELLKNIICTTYFSSERSGISYNLDYFYFYLESLEHRKGRLNLNRISLQADLLVERATIEELIITKDDLIEADILLTILLEWYLLSPNKENVYWCCVTSIYGHKTTFQNSLCSKSRFKNIQVLFGVENEGEFINRYREIAPLIKNDNRKIGIFKYMPSLLSIVREEQLFSML